MPKADEPLAVYVVLQTFGTDVDGVPTTYRKGETIDAHHPSVKRWPKLFGPLSLDHPLPAGRPSFAARMAAGRAAKAAASGDAADALAPDVQDALDSPEVRAD